MATATDSAQVNSTDDDDVIAQTLNKSVVFIAVYTHMWTGQSKIRDALVKMGHAEIAKQLVTNPRWNLLPSAWRKKFTAVHSKVQSVITKTSISSDELTFPVRGVHVISRNRYSEFAKTLKEIDTNDFQPLVKQFTTEWPSIVEGVLSQVDDLTVRSALSAKLPKTAEHLARKFWVEVIRVPIQLGGNFEAVDDETMQEIEEQGKQFTRNVAGMITQGLEEELRNSIDNLVERIDSKGIVKAGTLDMVKTAFRKFQDFEFVMTDELKDKMKEAQKRLGEYDHQELNKDLKHGEGNTAIKLLKVLKSVREQSVTDAAVIRSFGRARRSIRT